MTTDDRKIIIHMAGTATGNPGTGGYAAILEGAADHPGQELLLEGGRTKISSNQAELTALLQALRFINQSESPSDSHPSHSVVIRCRAEYVTNAFNRGWLASWKQRGWKKSNGRDLPNRDIWKSIDSELAKGIHTKVMRITDSASDPQIERCITFAVENAQTADDSQTSWDQARFLDPGNQSAPPYHRSLEERLADAERRLEQTQILVAEILKAARARDPQELHQLLQAVAMQ